MLRAWPPLGLDMHGEEYLMKNTSSTILRWSWWPGPPCSLAETSQKYSVVGCLSVWWSSMNSLQWFSNRSWKLEILRDFSRSRWYLYPEQESSKLGVVVIWELINRNYLGLYRGSYVDLGKRLLFQVSTTICFWMRARKSEGRCWRLTRNRRVITVAASQLSPRWSRACGCGYILRQTRQRRGFDDCFLANLHCPRSPIQNMYVCGSLTLKTWVWGRAQCRSCSPGDFIA